MDTVAVEDVVVDFSPEEWALLDHAQRKLYVLVMMETFRNLASVVSQKLDDREKLCTDSTIVQFLKSGSWSSKVGEICGFHIIEDQDKNRSSRARRSIEQNVYEIKKKSQCGQTYRWIPDLHVLQRTYHEPYPSLSLHCGKSSMDQSSSLNRHPGLHSECDTYQDGEHGAGCRCPYSHRPVRTLTEEKPKECTDYGSDSEEKPFGCKQRGKVFNALPDLARHLRTHSAEKPYERKVCEKSFTSPSHIVAHWRFHNGQKPYECKDCGKCFTHLCYLTGQRKTHSGERLYVCGECDKAFIHQSALIHHRRIHNEEGPFECKECGKAFTHRSYLDNHGRVHSGATPYECKECGTCFKYPSSLNRHENSQYREAL
ncbi:zinc finger protein 77-like [Tenrec ecaudatus]|uniref:zinc finger protein 77-like n=1 Tax=Tenrec ecaudatus TaxID=94439 RepID=UPI003F59D770